MPTRYSHGDRIEAAERDLEARLAEQATAGVPELALVAILRRCADDVEYRGHVPRRWLDSRVDHGPRLED